MILATYRASSKMFFVIVTQNASHGRDPVWEDSGELGPAVGGPCAGDSRTPGDVLRCRKSGAMRRRSQRVVDQHSNRTDEDGSEVLLPS